MNVTQLIEELKQFPQDTEIQVLWDGALRSTVEAVWLAQNGMVVLGELNEPIYHDEARIAGAPSSFENRYLYVGEMLFPESES